MPATANPTMLNLAANGQHAELFDRLADRLSSDVGYAFLTVLIPEDTGDFLTRVYSTDPVGHPLGRADPVVDDPWFDHLFDKGRPVFASNPDEIAEWLPDYQGLQGTDFGTLVNFPVVAGGQTVGIINLVSKANAYDEVSLERMAQLVPLAAMAIATYVRGGTSKAK
ncbi:MAG: GAF domain-containing protein [Alphaproteobacteria bacterium]|nr:GAF domain-containing protein [Alphaproteobacteria bacterium]